ncbi:hypothetical protein P7F88_04920 [Vibrio hannami]|uniref:hypothetical protein n=1 Tax=Vibrio hannami TaxID=2717094 RepID=UPI00241069DE|nr:hypothetical protein [Vibrio hannami]MDG3085477.1 hypothetical protein [Vibrio hannami]
MEDQKNDSLDTVEFSEDKSRFSRRRFIQAGAGASPLLFALKTPVAWGRGQSFGDGNCSVTVLLSANASNPTCTAEIKSPGYWHAVLGSEPGSTHYVVKQALANSNPSIYPTLAFNTFFLNGFSHSYRGWLCSISPTSDNPSFIDVLPSNGNGNGNSLGLTLLIRCVKAGSLADDLDIARIPNIHMISVAAYLNSMFAPSIIPYPYYPAQVIVAVQELVKSSVEAYIDKIEDGVTINGSVLNGIFGPLKDTFKSNFELW